MGKQQIEEMAVEIEAIDREIEKLKDARRVKNQRRVELACPFKRGDIIQEQTGSKRKMRVIRPIPHYDNYSIEGVRIKKDGTDGKVFTLGWWDMRHIEKVEAN